MTLLSRRVRGPMVLSLAALAIAFGCVATSARATFAGPVGRIAFSDYTTGQIYAVNPDGTGLRQLTHGKPGSVADAASWSPSGKRLIFAFNPTPEAPARIWVMAADGSHRHRLSSDVKGFRDVTPSYGPGGRLVVFARCQPGDGVCAIWRMRGDGSHMRALTPYRTGTRETVDFDPTISPNGKRVAFTRFYAGGVQSRVFVIGINGRHPHPVTPAFLEADSPDWSPGGKLLAFGTNSQRVGSSIFTIKPNGTGLKQITTDRYPQNAIGPVFSPRGNRLAFSDDRRYSDHCCLDLFSIGLDGNHEHKVAFGSKSRGGINPAWGSAPLLRP
jgi:Tol biopolymer transport system component